MFLKKKIKSIIRMFLPLLLTTDVLASTNVLNGVSPEKHWLSLEEWIFTTEPLVTLNLLKNISPFDAVAGVVVASPSRREPNYYYHWVRDASLVMNVIVKKYVMAKNNKEKHLYHTLLLDFINFSKSNQTTLNLSGGLGEPKFNVDGSAYMESWGRPQNDSPALRALTFIHLAKVWLSEKREPLVRSLLYSKSFTSVIKADLEYVSHHWRDTCFDLWEETRGRHFYTLMVERAALIEGAHLARELKDYLAADWYFAQAQIITNELNRFWSPEQNIVMQTLDRDGGSDYKFSNLDSATVLAVLHSTLSHKDGFYDVSDDRIQATVYALEKKFSEIYEINKKGHRGIAIGRYPEDRYNGRFNDLNFTQYNNLGNPWFLTTLAFAEFYYRLVKEIQDENKIEITSRNLQFWNALGYGKNKNIQYLLAALKTKGDDFMYTVQFHMNGSHMSEQFSRYTGYMEGAADLTWSYESFLRAIEQRSTIFQGFNKK